MSDRGRRSPTEDSFGKRWRGPDPSLALQLVVANKKMEQLDDELRVANENYRKLVGALTMDDRQLLQELLAANEKIRQLERSYANKLIRKLEHDYSRKAAEVFRQQLTVKVRGIETTVAQLESSIRPDSSRASQLSTSQRPALGGPAQETGPLPEQSQAAEEDRKGLQSALRDLEDRLQQAVGLVLNELNTRKAAEARIRELEDQLAAVRRRTGREG